MYGAALTKIYLVIARVSSRAAAWIGGCGQPRTLTSTESGNAAQRYAEKMLRRQGYRLLERNFADGRGELDLVLHAPDGCLAVVEVRSFTFRPGRRLDDVLPAGKQRQVVETARRLLSAKFFGRALRFDAALVALDESGRPTELQHIPNAFMANRRDWF